MKECIAIIRKNKTGETKSLPIIIRKDKDSGEWDFYIWEEGNYACDCNRSKLFGEDRDICTAELYDVNIVAENGEVIYQEF